MSTKRALKIYSKKSTDGLNVLTGEKAERFAKLARDSREKIYKQQRTIEPEKKDMFLLKKSLKEVISGNDPNMASLFTLLQRAKAAEKARPGDTGVKALRIMLEKKWSKNRTAELSPKELGDVRSYFTGVYPDSYVSELLSPDPEHGVAPEDYGQVTKEPDPMHKRIYSKIAAYPDGGTDPVELVKGTEIRVRPDMELGEGGDFENPVVIEAGGLFYVAEKDVVERALKSVLTPEAVAKKIAELHVKYPRAKNQIDVVASEETGFDIQVTRRAQKFGLTNDAKGFLAEWDNFKKHADDLGERVEEIVDEAKQQIDEAVKDKVEEVMSVDEVPEEEEVMAEGEDVPPDVHEEEEVNTTDDVLEENLLKEENDEEDEEPFEEMAKKNIYITAAAEMTGQEMKKLLDSVDRNGDRIIEKYRAEQIMDKMEAPYFLQDVLKTMSEIGFLRSDIESIADAGGGRFGKVEEKDTKVSMSMESGNKAADSDANHEVPISPIPTTPTDMKSEEEDQPDGDLESEAAKKKASEYTDFTSKYMKENPGSSLGDAAKAWKSKGGGGEKESQDEEEEKKDEKEEKEED